MFNALYMRHRDLWHEFTNAMKLYRGGMEPVDMMGFANNGLVRQGDGHCALLMQGFLENNVFAASVNDSLKTLGYKPHYFEGGWNFVQGDEESPEWNLGHAEKRLVAVWEENKQRPVSIIAHSAGGAQAHYLTIEHADKIRNIITLAAPIRPSMFTGDYRAPLSDVFLRWCKNHPVVNDPKLMREIYANIGRVPAISIIDVNDAGVHPMTCILPQTNLTQNIFVHSAGQDYSGHYGIWANPDAHKIIALVLEQPLGCYSKLSREQLKRAEVKIDWDATLSAKNNKLEDELKFLDRAVAQQSGALVDLSR